MPTKQPKILIVEDDSDLVTVFESAFEARGYCVEVCTNGLDGITKAVEFKPDLILLDLMMPQMDGFELLKALRDNTSLKTIVAVNSNVESESEVKKAKKLGANYFFKKSRYTPFQIVEEVSKILKVPVAKNDKKGKTQAEMYATDRKKSLKKKHAKILIVEDDVDLVTIFQSAFVAKGFDVRTSINGLDGITQAAEFKPDLILLDIMMPQMDGYELLKALKENTSLNSLVVINSNLEQDEDVKRAIKLGADHYFKKSRYTPFKIVEDVSKILGIKS